MRAKDGKCSGVSEASNRESGAEKSLRELDEGRLADEFDSAFDAALDEVFGVPDAGLSAKASQRLPKEPEPGSTDISLRTVKVRKVIPTEQDLFLLQIEKKFRELLRQSEDPQAEIADAARRLMNEDLLFRAPDPNVSPRQAAFEMIGDNDMMAEIWMDVRDRRWWESAETAEELILSLLPKRDSLD